MLRSGIWLKISILLLSLMPMEIVGPIMPALGEIAKSFPNASPTLIGYITTVPSLGMLFMAVISAGLTVRFNKKKILMTGMLLYFIGGVAPFFYTESILFILVMRLLLGIGTGLCLPLTIGLIVEFYQGRERASMLGFASAIMAIAGIITSIAAGYVAMNIGWRYNFLIYLFVIVVLLLGWFNIPNMPNVKGAEASGPKVAAERGMWTSGVIFLFVFTLLYSIFTSATGVAVPLFVMVEDIGNPAQLGLALGLTNACAFIFSLTFGRIHKQIGMYVLSVGMLIFTIAALSLGLAHNFTLIIIALALTGVYQGLTPPCFEFGVASIVNKKFASFAMGLLVAVLSGGMFLAAPVMGLILNLWGQNYRFFYYTLTGIGAAMTIAVTIFIYVNKGMANAAPLHKGPLPEDGELPPPPIGH